MSCDWGKSDEKAFGKKCQHGDGADDKVEQSRRKNPQVACEERIDLE